MNCQHTESNFLLCYQIRRTIELKKSNIKENEIMFKILF